MKLDQDQGVLCNKETREEEKGNEGCRTGDKGIKEPVREPEAVLEYERKQPATQCGLVGR